MCKINNAHSNSSQSKNALPCKLWTSLSLLICYLWAAGDWNCVCSGDPRLVCDIKNASVYFTTYNFCTQWSRIQCGVVLWTQFNAGTGTLHLLVMEPLRSVWFRTQELSWDAVWICGIALPFDVVNQRLRSIYVPACMYVRLYVWICLHVCTWMCVRTCVCQNVCLHNMRVSAGVCIRCMCARVCVCVCVCLHVCVCQNHLECSETMLQMASCEPLDW